MVRFNLESISEHPISLRGEEGRGGFKQQTGMDGDQVHFYFSARGEPDAGLEGRPACRFRFRLSAMGDVRSALFPPGAAVFAATGPQQCLQSHLHKRLEVIASLPSAVLLGVFYFFICV